MEKAMALAQQQQQQQYEKQKQLLLQQQQQQQQHQHPHQQQFLLLQQIQQQQAISRFPSNIDAHLRSSLLPIKNQQQPQNPNPSYLQNPNALHLQLNRPQPLPHSSPANHSELQMAYQDAWRVCHPDFKRPFSSLEDACERLLPYHVVADYEAEEDDRILDSDSTGQALSRSQQWDHNIANKVSEFTATFEKQVLAFNIISQKRTMGEFRSEERLLVEQILLQEERRALLEARTEMETRGREAHAASMRMAVIAQAEQARAKMMARAPIRASALGPHEMDQEAGTGEDGMMMMNGWVDNIHRDEREACEDFLNDEERENGDIGMQSDWRGGGEFDLNLR